MIQISKDDLKTWLLGGLGRAMAYAEQVSGAHMFPFGYPDRWGQGPGDTIREHLLCVNGHVVTATIKGDLGLRCVCGAPVQLMPPEVAQVIAHTRLDEVLLSDAGAWPFAHTLGHWLLYGPGEAENEHHHRPGIVELLILGDRLLRMRFLEFLKSHSRAGGAFQPLGRDLSIITGTLTTRHTSGRHPVRITLAPYAHVAEWRPRYLGPKVIATDDPEALPGLPPFIDSKTDLVIQVIPSTSHRWRLCSSTFDRLSGAIT